MINNRLTLLVKTFNRKEMTRFGEYVWSPYFNKHQDVRNLVTYLSRIFPNFSEKNCHREVVFNHLYPTLPHNQSKLALVYTYTLKLAEQFLKQQLAEQEGLLQDEALLLKGLRQRDFLFFVEKKWVGKAGGGRNTSAMMGEPDQLMDSSYFERKHRLAKEKDACAAHQSLTDHHFLGEKQYWLDALFFTEKLKDGCEMRQRSKLYQVHYNEGMLRKVIAEVSENLTAYQSLAPVIIYYHLHGLLNSEPEKPYSKVITIVEKYETQLPKDEVQNVYNYLQNYCIEQINKGNQDFLRELFDLYRSQLDKELLFADGYLPEWHFKNIVTTGLRLNEMAWVESFLTKYRERLHPDVAENAYSYNLASFYYQLQRFDKVLDLLIKVEYTDLRYSLDAKALLLRTYYDTAEEDALLALVDAFKQYLKRNKQLSDFQKKGYFNLLKFTRRAFQLKMSKDFMQESVWKKRLQQLSTEVNQVDTVFNRSWLSSKLVELSNG